MEDEIKPLLVSIKQTRGIIARGQSAIYELIGEGKIRAVKSNGRTLIDYESLVEYKKSLKPAVIAPPRRRKPQHLRAAANV
jgi:hypothetical protein